MPIPQLDAETGALPAGDHVATLEELGERFAYNYRRERIFEGLCHVLSLLEERGVQSVWIDGSFVTDSQRPNDVDVVYVAPSGSDVRGWGWVSPQRRRDLKKHYRVDLWKFPSNQPHKSKPGRQMSIKEFFESDEDGRPKGLISLTLGGTE